MTGKELENIESGEDAVLTDSPSSAPDPKLTLAPTALAGSAACLNCGTPLKGPYCYYCGQPDRNFMRFFPALLREVVSEALEFDSRFTRTMIPLLFKPGRLTRDYLDGRRFRFTPPLRLYLFSSIVFFLLAAVLSSDAIEIGIDSNEPAIGIQITAESQEELAQLEQTLAELPPELREQIPLNMENATVRDQENEKFFEEGEINLNGEPWHPVDNPVDFAWFPDWLNDRLNEEVSNSPEKARRIGEDPRLIMREIFDILPIAMFILLPVVALIFKFWYLFSGRFYIEHLILALHNHSFVFVILIFAILLETLETFAANRGMALLENAVLGLSLLLLAWIPFYLIGSLRTVYRQGWFMTLGKGLVIGFSYMMLLLFVTVAVALLGFILV